LSNKKYAVVFIDANATLIIEEQEILVRFQKRAHNPLLIAAGFDKTLAHVPWLKEKKIHFVFG